MSFEKKERREGWRKEGKEGRIKKNKGFKNNSD